MGDDGPRDLPRPPRRVPAGADSGTAMRARTVIEARPGRPQRPRPPVRPPRAWYLLPLLIAVILAGAGTGWLIRERAAAFDLEQIVDEAGPAVVRVHATSCSGTGLATGLLVDDDLVLTVASALRGPVSVAVETADGRVRPGQVDGVDAAGVAVVRLLGEPLGISPVPLADVTPVDGLDVPVLGYIDNRQDADLHAITRAAGADDLSGVSGLLPASAAGSAVLDRQGRAIGLITQPTQTATRAVGLDVLREFVGRSRKISVERAVPGCTAKGAQTAVVPDLDGPSGPLAEQAQTALGEFLTAINRHDPQAVLDASAGRLAKRLPSKLEAQYRMEYNFGAVIRSVRQDGDGAQAEMTFTTLQAMKAAPLNHKCLRYDILYELDRVNGKLRVEWATAARSQQDSFRVCTVD